MKFDSTRTKNSGRTLHQSSRWAPLSDAETSEPIGSDVQSMDTQVKKSTDCCFVWAHADDEHSCVSIIHMLAKNHRSVDCLTMTGGGSEREAEGRRSLSGLLGKAYDPEEAQYLNYPDTQLNTVVPHMAEVIREKIDQLNPRMIVTHDPKDSHSDHVAVFRAVEIASRYTCQSLLTFGGPSVEPGRFSPNFFLPLDSQVMERKLESAHAHQSQCCRPYMQTPFLLGVAMSWKFLFPFLAQRDDRFFEAFRIIRLVDGLGPLGPCA